jgi:hypothetical protein
VSRGENREEVEKTVVLSGSKDGGEDKLELGAHRVSSTEAEVGF